MYKEFFNLDRKPFQLSPDPRFFFGSSIHKRALAYLRYGLSQAEGFIAITGEVGTGKTTLVRTLFRELPENEVVAAQIVTTQLQADDLLRMVAQAFGLEVSGDSKSTLLARLEKFLMNRAREGKRVLLVVDEAQNLAPQALEELRMLSNFQVGDKPLLQSFLLGQAQFRRTLQHDDLEQLRQRFIAACHLTPLNEQETREYIEYRLTTAGWKNDPAFSDEAFSEIHRYTQGIPRRINNLADRLLLFTFLEERHDVDADTVRTVARELEDELSPMEDDSAAIAIPEAATDYAMPAMYSWGNLELRVAAMESRVQALEKSMHRGFSRVKRVLQQHNGVEE